MEERVRELEETIEDFEQMKMIDEEMQENSRETERELRQEIDLASGRMNEVNRDILHFHNNIHIVKIREARIDAIQKG